jgi:dethiobiotin synthetase
LNTLLIAGTDVAVGKTVVTSALAAYWQTYGAERSLSIFKPVQIGGGDRDHYLRLFNLQQTPQEVAPLVYKTAIAPPLAAAREESPVQLDLLWQQFTALAQRSDWLLVEGFGGLGSPLTAETTFADLAWDWHLPTILVVPVRLGAIGQAMAHVALARQSRVHLKGIVLNCPQPCSLQEAEDWAPATLIKSLTGVPVLGLVPHLSDPTHGVQLAQVASELELERIMPLAFQNS